MTNPETKTCQNCDNQFVIEGSDFDFYKKIDVPPPTWCPECREQRRLSLRNERSLYKRECDMCGESVVGLLSPDKPQLMYCQKCWWSDKWDPLEYGMEYDFRRPFFEQLSELLLKVPHVALFGGANNVDSSYLNLETDDKNCYFQVGGHFNENSAYNTYLIRGKESFDNYWTLNSELCYENIFCERCYKTSFSEECHDCQEVILSYDCRNSSYLFGCAGLRNKKYCIWNKQVSKIEYEDFISKNPTSSFKNLRLLKEKAEKVWLSVPHRDRFTIKAVNSNGHHVINSKNAKNCWLAEDMEDVKNFYIALGMKDSQDGTSVGWGELIYESACGGGFYDSKFIAYIFGGTGKVDAVNSSNLEYCYHAPSSNNCFGSVNMFKKEYCILNKQYSKEEYNELIPRIKSHMNEMAYKDKAGRIYKYGEFFPPELSIFGYNETVAQDYFPLTKKEAIENGFNWSNFETNSNYEISDYDIPDDISDVKDDILKNILKCEISGKAYRIVPMELQFYRRMGLPIPRRSPQQRHKDRVGRLLPRRLFNRNCNCVGRGSKKGNYKNTANEHPDHVLSNRCPNQIDTPYAPDRPEIVYCESCYQAEIV